MLKPSAWNTVGAQQIRVVSPNLHPSSPKLQSPMANLLLGIFLHVPCAPLADKVQISLAHEDPKDLSQCPTPSWLHFQTKHRSPLTSDIPAFPLLSLDRFRLWLFSVSPSHCASLLQKVKDSSMVDCDVYLPGPSYSCRSSNSSPVECPFHPDNSCYHSPLCFAWSLASVSQTCRRIPILPEAPQQAASPFSCLKVFSTLWNTPFSCTHKSKKSL